MKNSTILTIVCLVVALALSAFLGVVINRSTQGKSSDESSEILSELEKYVQKQDSSYSYRILPEYTTRGRDDSFTVFVLNMTSQTWLSRTKVTHTIWWHYLTVVIPDDIKYTDVGCLYVTGDSNDDEPRNPLLDPEFQLVTELSTRTGIVCAMQRQNPNGPIKFFSGKDVDNCYFGWTHLKQVNTWLGILLNNFYHVPFVYSMQSLGDIMVPVVKIFTAVIVGLYKDDPEEAYRSSDDLIAYTFKYFLEGHMDEPEAVLLMPMVKAMVRGMDTVTNFVDSRIQRFLVCGASKRGWTAWLAAAVDKRIIGVMPLVLDALNMQENFAHHYRSMNGWSWALKDYWYHNITTYLSDPINQKLAEIVDPFAYRDKLTLPKYIITAGSDEFFLPDDSHYYYDRMSGPTYLRIHPNTDHILIGRYRELVDETEGFIYMVLENGQFPTITWRRTEGNTIGSIVLTTNMEPINITAWMANSYTDTRRDFRVIVARTPNTTDVMPQVTTYSDIGVGRVGTDYIATIEKPTKGWSCFFIEMTFPAPNGSHIVVTSEAHIVPDTFPVGDCYGPQCKGTLV